MLRGPSQSWGAVLWPMVLKDSPSENWRTASSDKASASIFLFLKSSRVAGLNPVQLSSQKEPLCHFRFQNLVRSPFRLVAQDGDEINRRLVVLLLKYSAPPTGWEYMLKKCMRWFQNSFLVFYNIHHLKNALNSFLSVFIYFTYSKHILSL